MQYERLALAVNTCFQKMQIRRSQRKKSQPFSIQGRGGRDRRGPAQHALGQVTRSVLGIGADQPLGELNAGWGVFWC